MKTRGRGKRIYSLKRVNVNSPITAIMSNKIQKEKVVVIPKPRTRKKRFGIFTKKEDE